MNEVAYAPKFGVYRDSCRIINSRQFHEVYLRIPLYKRQLYNMDKMKSIITRTDFRYRNIGCRRGGRLELRSAGDFKSRLADYNSRIACSRDELRY